MDKYQFRVEDIAGLGVRLAVCEEIITEGYAYWFGCILGIATGKIPVANEGFVGVVTVGVVGLLE